MRIQYRVVAFLSVLLLGAGSAVGHAASDVPLKDKLTGRPDGTASEETQLPAYSEMLAGYGSCPQLPAGETVYGLDALHLETADGSGAPAQSEELYGKTGVRWDNEALRAVYTLDVGQEGLYQIRLDYALPEGSSLPARRTLLVDGGIPFEEAAGMTFDRLWMDKGQPL